MSELEVKVDVKKGRLKFAKAVFAGSKLTVTLLGYNEPSTLALYYLDRRVFTEPNIAPRVRVFPAEGIRCVATSTNDNGVMTLNLSTQEILDIFSTGEFKLGSSVFLYAYLWNEEEREVVAQGIFQLEYSPVYFKVDGTPVTMKGEKGDDGDKGDNAIKEPIEPKSIVMVDESGIELKGTGLKVDWLKGRVTCKREINGVLSFRCES